VITLFPLLKCLKTHYRQHCEPFSGQTCTGICIFNHIHVPLTVEEAPWCLDPDTNFCFARQRPHCSCFTKRPLGGGGQKHNQTMLTGPLMIIVQRSPDSLAGFKAEDTRGRKPTFGTCVMRKRLRFSTPKIGAGFRLRLERVLVRGRFLEARDR